jgi:hypothetical protein
MYTRIYRANAAKLKLGKFSSTMDDDLDMPSGPFGRKDASSLPTNWKFALVGCGSNAFGQLNVDGIVHICLLCHSFILFLSQIMLPALSLFCAYIRYHVL